MDTNNRKNHEPPLVIPWYRPEDWTQWTEYSQDKMCKSHEEWILGAEAAVKKLSKSGSEVHCIEIGFSEFRAWESAHGMGCTGYSRGKFAMEKLAKRLLKPDIQPKDIPTSKELKEFALKLKGRDQSEIWEPYLRRPKASICPLIRERNGNFEQFASGVLISVGHANFMLSAAHVGEEMEENGILVPFKSCFGYLQGKMTITKRPNGESRAHDRLDIFFLRLNQQTTDELHDDFLFLAANECSLTDTTEAKNMYTMIGYPARRSKSDRSTVSTQLICYSGDGVNDARYEQLDCEHWSHILVQHRRKKAINYLMQRSHSPIPEGMSGGGMFAWNKQLPKLSAIEQPLLAGIVTEYHEGRHVFVATKLELFLQAIRHYNPDLAPYFIS